MTAYPLQWPVGFPRTETPIPSKFGKNSITPSVAKSTEKVINEIKLLRKLRTMSKSDVIISTNIKLRQDGFPFSNQAEPVDKGVAVYFPFGNEKRVLACDKFNKTGCNLWAIARTIENIREIERDGASDFLNRAFLGFKALPEKTSGTPWWEILQCSPASSYNFIKSAHRHLLLKYHPDRRDTGDEKKYQEVQEAFKQAEQLFKVTKKVTA